VFGHEHGAFGEQTEDTLVSGDGFLADPMETIRGVGQNFKWKYKMAGVLIEGESTVTELVPNKRMGFQTKGAVASDWLLVVDAKDGGTEVELNIEYTIPVPVLGKVAEKLVLKRNEREADLAMENIKMIMED